jgi:hypothetical protein
MIVAMEGMPQWATFVANGSQASLAITDAITGTADTQTCTYQHDDMGRLASSSCGGLWGRRTRSIPSAT